MSKVLIQLSMSLDGFIAGPNDGKERPLGERGGPHLFDWYRSGEVPDRRSALFKPEGENRRVIDEMFREVGCMLTGKRTYEIANGWNGEHPVNAIPVVILTHHLPDDAPHGKSPLIFVTTGIASAVERAKKAAGSKAVGIGSASVAQQALRARLVDEIYLHVAPIVLGAGVRLFDQLGEREIRLEKLSVLDGPHATHLRYRVVKE